MLKKFKDYMGNRRLAKIEKAAKLIKNPKAIKEDRWAALEFLESLDEAEQAVPALLQRFEYSLEHGINDTREKELALKGISKHGPNGLPYLKTHLGTTSRIAWPIKALKEIADEKALVETLYGVLNFNDVAFDQAAVDKNYDVLCYLRDLDCKGLSEKLCHFLKDPDERVRYAAVELIIEQNESNISASLEDFLLDHSAENRRITEAIKLAFKKNGWKVQKPEVQAQLT